MWLCALLIALFVPRNEVIDASVLPVEEQFLGGGKYLYFCECLSLNIIIVRCKVGLCVHSHILYAFGCVYMVAIIINYPLLHYSNCVARQKFVEMEMFHGSYSDFAFCTLR